MAASSAMGNSPCGVAPVEAKLTAEFGTVIDRGEEKVLQLLTLAYAYNVDLSRLRPVLDDVARRVLADAAALADARRELAIEHLLVAIDVCKRVRFTGPELAEALRKYREMKQLPPGWDLEEVHAAAEAGAPSKLRTDDDRVVEAFQALFDRTWKRVYTRDRKGRVVPSGVVVDSVTKVINLKLWEDYTLRREMVLYADGAKGGRAREVARLNQDPATYRRGMGLGIKAPLTTGWVASDAAAAGLDFALREDVNEAILFHGTNKAAAEGITDEDFRLNLAGSNAGTLFGRGIYLAECVSKSDEYTKEEPCTLRCKTLVQDAHTILVCRATLGRGRKACRE